MTKHHTEAKLRQALEAVNKHGSQTAAAVALGLPRTTLQARWREAQRLKIKPGSTPQDHPESLKAQIRRLNADIKSLAQESADAATIKALVGDLKEQIEEFSPPQWIVQPKAGKHSPGVPTLFLSDFHWGEVVHPSQINGVNQYNLKTARERLRYVVSTAINLCRILDPEMRYPGIVAALGGDMISGNIHDELMATNELNTMPTVLDLFGELAAAINVLADVFGAVFLPCVGGNHGRDTRKTWAKDRNHTSFDWLTYRFLAKHFENDKRVTFFVPDGPDASFRIYDYRYLLTHGDQFRGGDGMIGALGPIIRGDHKKRSRNSQIDMEYDTLMLGHWHQMMMLTRLIVNGSLKGYDEYAFAGNFPFELPTQGLWITHPDHGITYRMHVYADEAKTKARKNDWVSIRKGP